MSTPSPPRLLKYGSTLFPALLAFMGLSLVVRWIRSGPAVPIVARVPGLDEVPADAAAAASRSAALRPQPGEPVSAPAGRRRLPPHGRGSAVPTTTRSAKRRFGWPEPGLPRGPSVFGPYRWATAMPRRLSAMDGFTCSITSTIRLAICSAVSPPQSARPWRKRWPVLSRQAVPLSQKEQVDRRGARRHCFHRRSCRRSCRRSRRRSTTPSSGPSPMIWSNAGHSTPALQNGAHRRYRPIGQHAPLPVVGRRPRDLAKRGRGDGRSSTDVADDPRPGGRLRHHAGPKVPACLLGRRHGKVRWLIDLVLEHGATVPPWYAGNASLIDSEDRSADRRPRRQGPGDGYRLPYGARSSGRALTRGIGS